MTVGALAARCSVCTATIYGLVKVGKLRALRVGNSLRVRVDEVERYEREREGAGTERPRNGAGGG